jgi:hypothetical protein
LLRILKSCLGRSWLHLTDAIPLGQVELTDQLVGFLLSVFLGAGTEQERDAIVGMLMLISS